MKVLYAIVTIGACAVPASALSLIAAAATSHADGFVAGDDVDEDLLAALRAVTDPRCRRGVRGTGRRPLLCGDRGVGA